MFERNLPMLKKSLVNRLFNHTKTITLHKLKVASLCYKMGLIKQGLLHDLSKYSWVEFSSGVKYYQGYRSPIDAEKEVLGYSHGWLHHKGRNKHHWEYWTDKNKDGFYPIAVPYRYVAEMICDRVAATKIYQGKDYTESSPYNYFINGIDRIYMHPETAKQIEELLSIIKDDGLEQCIKVVKKKLKDCT